MVVVMASGATESDVDNLVALDQERGRAQWLANGLRPFHPALAAVERLTPTPSTSDGLLWRGKRWVQRACAPPGERYAWRMMHFDPFLKSTLCTPAFLERTGGDVSAALLRSCYEHSRATTRLFPLARIKASATRRMA